MATFIRTHAHDASIASGTGSSIAANTAAVVAPGNTLVAIVAGDESRTVSSLTKPVGEPAVWARVSGAPSASGSVFAEVWAIKTTVAWASGFTITAALSSTCTGRALSITEWAGVSVATQGSATTRASSASTVTAALGDVLVPGDLAVYIGAANTGGSSSNRISTVGSRGTATGTAPVGFGSQRPGNHIETNIQVLAVAGSGTFARTVEAIRLSGDAFIPTSRPLVVVVVGLRSDDYPPDAPTLTTNAGGQSVDRARTIRLGWTFSSPNFVDSQSKYDLRYRLVGDTGWTTVSATNGTASRDFAGGTFAPGDYEWQVRVYGALGKASGWSASGYFTAAEAPDGPTLTYPVDGQAVDQFETATWSTPVQDAYQLRRVGDDAGAPDESVIYFDSGTVADPSVRALALNFSVNDRFEHVQVRVRNAGLWSEWDSIRVEVSYTPPPTPTRDLYVDEGTGSLLVVIANPEPVGDDPAAVYNDIWVDDGDGWERRATGLATNGSWRYWTPKSGRDYATSIRVVAIAANGTTATSS